MMLDLKRLSDYENDLKLELKELKENDIEVNNESNAYISKLVNGFWFDVILIILNIVFFSKISIIIIILAALDQVKTFSNLVKFAGDIRKYKEKYEFNQNILDQKIEACELLKDYIRRRNLSKDDLKKIASYLYLDFNQDLEFVVEELEKQCGEKIEIFNCNNKEKIERKSIYEYNTPELIVDKPMTRTLKKR